MDSGHLVKTNPIKPNFRKAKMVVTLLITMTNNNEQRTTNCSKQTQSNPIKPNFARQDKRG